MPMKKNLTYCLCLLFTGLGFPILHAQQAITASGADAFGSGGSVAYSIGQAAYTANTGGTGSTNQGVQQAYEIFVVDSEEVYADISFAVFPNPTTNNLILEIKGNDMEKLSYQLFDAQGKLINQSPVLSQQTFIDLRALPAATYFLSVFQKNKCIRSFKLVKN